MPSTLTSFDSATKLSELPVDQVVMPAGEGVLSQHRYGVDLHPAWTISGKANGGYLAALLAKAAITAGTLDHVVALNAQFLRPPANRAAEVHTEMLRDGRSLDQLRSRIVQDGQIIVEALVTLGELAVVAKPHWDLGAPGKPELDPERLVRLPTVSPDGTALAIYGQIDLRLDIATLGFAGGQPSGNGEFRGTIELPEGRNFDSPALVFALDAFPPASMEIELAGLAPTISYTTYLRALPAPGPVTVLHQARVIADRRMDETTTVWDSAGALVAQATQLAAIRLG